jgi:hypothetical protein
LGETQFEVKKEHIQHNNTVKFTGKLQAGDDKKAAGIKGDVTISVKVVLE